MYPQSLLLIILLSLTLTLSPLITAFPHPYPHPDPHPHHEQQQQQQQPPQEGITFPTITIGRAAGDDTSLLSLPTLSLPTSFSFPTAFPTTIPGFGSGFGSGSGGGGFSFPTGFPSVGVGGDLDKKNRRRRDGGSWSLIPTFGTGLPPLSLPSFTTSGIDTLPTGFPALTGLGFVPTGLPDSGVAGVGTVIGEGGGEGGAVATPVLEIGDKE